MTLDELLALLPDNTTGAIDAADLRAIVTDLFDKTATLAASTQGLYESLDARVAALESAPGGGGVTTTGYWQYNPAPEGDPGELQVTSDAASPATATWLRFTNTAHGLIDMSASLTRATAIYAQEIDSSTNRVRYTVTGPATSPGPGLTQVPVQVVSSGGNFAGAAWKQFMFVFQGGS